VAQKIEIFFIIYKLETTNNLKMNAQHIESSIVKQATINCASLPDLVLAKIKDYLFYDPRASKQMQSTRKHKSKILVKIKHARTREKHHENMINEYNKYKDEDGFDFDSLDDYLYNNDHLPDVFLFDIIDKAGILHYTMMTIFCTDCGNYQKIRTIFTISPIHDKCLCVCKVCK